MSAAFYPQVQKIYVAYYGRPADPAGLQYWAGQLAANGGNLTSIINAFGASAESTALYAGADNSAKVTAIYQQLFNRAPDAAGLAFYTAELTANRMTASSIALNVANGAQGTDATYLNNKVTVATSFTDSLTVDSAAAVAYTGTTATTAARSLITGVTTSAATTNVASTITSIKAGGGAAAGQTFTLTANVDGISGTAGDDVFRAVMASGTSTTLNVGDAIDGGAGRDTLNIIDQAGTAVGIVSLTNVEVVNVRVLVASGTDVSELNAADWTGVAVLSNATSLADSEFQFSGLSTTTQVVLHGNTDISGNFANDTTADVSIGAVNAGTFAGVTTYGATAVTANATAHITIDGASAGLISGVSIALSGNNLLSVDAGPTADSFTITGAGSAVLFTTAQLATADASSFAGNLDLTLNGVSDVTVKGGGGNDTIRLGTTISNNDSIVGGAGTDSVQFSIGGFSRNLQATGVENAVIRFNDANGGAVNTTASTVGTYFIAAGSASADATLNGLANNSTVTFGDAASATADGLDDVVLDGASGATNLTINFGSATGGMNVTGLSVTDVTNVVISAVSNSTGTNVISSATFDDDVKSVTIITRGGDADLDMSAMALGGVTSLSIQTNGSADFSMHSAFDAATALAQVNLAASGTAATILLNDLGSGIGLTTITIDANAGADVFASGVTFGNSGSAAISTYTISIAAETDSSVGTAAIGNSGIVIDTTGVASLIMNISAAASSTVHVGDVTLLQGIATASAAGGVLTFSAGTIGTNAIVRIEEINSNATFTGTQVVLGSVTLGASAELTLWSGGVAASGVSDFDVQALNLTLGASAIVEVAKGSGFETTAGSIGAISITAADGASATFGAIAASAVGAFTVNVASGASANFGAITTVAAATAAAVGSFELGGKSGGGVTFSTIAASGVGAIAVSGGLDVTFGTITSPTIGSIDASNQTVSGAFTIDLSGVQAAAEVRLGAATNIVISGVGNDVVTLKAGGTGNDTIRYNSTAQGTDNIINFFAGSTGLDVISIAAAIGTASIRAGNGSALAAGATIDLSVVINGTGASATLAATDNVILLGTSLANTAAMEAFFNTAVTFASAAIASSNFIVAWTDGTDAYISILGSTDAGSANAVTLSSASAAISSTVLATLSGVTPGALSANNFTIV